VSHYEHCNYLVHMRLRPTSRALFVSSDRVRQLRLRATVDVHRIWRSTEDESLKDLMRNAATCSAVQAQADAAGDLLADVLGAKCCEAHGHTEATTHAWCAYCGIRLALQSSVSPEASAVSLFVSVSSIRWKPSNRDNRILIQFPGELTDRTITCTAR
jgi:hypothetical protein